jgi:hypothetical protein
LFIAEDASLAAAGPVAPLIAAIIAAGQVNHGAAIAWDAPAAPAQGPVPAEPAPLGPAPSGPAMPLNASKRSSASAVSASLASAVT